MHTLNRFLFVVLYLQYIQAACAVGGCSLANSRKRVRFEPDTSADDVQTLSWRTGKMIDLHLCGDQQQVCSYTMLKVNPNLEFLLSEKNLVSSVNIITFYIQHITIIDVNNIDINIHIDNTE